MTRSARAEREIPRLREEIEAIDRSLVLLLNARLRAQHRVLQVKRAEGLPLTTPAQERVVVERAKAWSRESGGDPDIAATILRQIIRAGKELFFHGSPPPPADDYWVTVRLSPEVLPASPRTPVPPVAYARGASGVT